MNYRELYKIIINYFFKFYLILNILISGSFLRYLKYNKFLKKYKFQRKMGRRKINIKYQTNKKRR